MAQPPVNPSKKAKLNTKPTELRDVKTTGGQDILSKATQRSAGDVARLEETLKRTAKKIAAGKTAVAAAPSPAEESKPTNKPSATIASSDGGAAASDDLAATAPALPDATPVPPLKSGFGELAMDQGVSLDAAPAATVVSQTPHVEPAEPRDAPADRCLPLVAPLGWSNDRAEAASTALDDFADGLSAIHRVAFDALRQNTRLAVEFCTSMANVRNLGDAVDAQAILARASLEVFAEQATDLHRLAQRLVLAQHASTQLLIQRR